MQQIVEERYQDGIDRSQERVFSGEDIIKAYIAGFHNGIIEVAKDKDFFPKLSEEEMDKLKLLGIENPKGNEGFTFPELYDIIPKEVYKGSKAHSSLEFFYKDGEYHFGWINVQSKSKMLVHEGDNQRDLLRAIYGLLSLGLKAGYIEPKKGK